MIDFHLHPNYSIDSRATIDGMVGSAIEKGLDAICFTTHIDLNPKRSCLDGYIAVNGVLCRFCPEGVEAYIRDVRDAGIKYSDRLDIKLGFELSYGGHFEDQIKEFLERFDYDFILGAVHCMDNLAITSRAESSAFFRINSCVEAVKRYVESTLRLVESGLFRTVAHIDGLKKYGRAFYGPDLDYMLAELLEPVLRRMADLDVGIELNTSALRKGLDEIYPSARILEMASKFGVRVNSVGSDAHVDNQVGCDLEKAYDAIDKFGLDIGQPLAFYDI